MSERDFWLAFNHVKSIGAVRFRKLLKHFGSLSAAWRANPDQLLAAGLTAKSIEQLLTVRKKISVEKLEEDYSKRGIKAILWEDPSYPKLLAEIPQAPPVLYVLGELKTEDELAFAIVGTRNVTAYGKQVTRDTAEVLSKSGVCIVSGLARGVDAIAHQTAISCGGRTIAVLGSGVDVIYPPEHRKLAEKICLHGAVISDYAPGTKPEGINFPPRNRIISGLSRGVLVIEAGERSGALITAKFSADQGREVFAVPGSVLAAMSRGTNDLIAQGATPMTNPKLLLDFLKIGGNPSEKQAARSIDPEQAKILHALGSETKHIDDLANKLDYTMEKLSAALIMMELEGLVSKTESMHYTALVEWRY